MNKKSVMILEGQFLYFFCWFNNFDLYW